MAQAKPNPTQYESHFPNFRNVEWNPDPIDIGAIVQGEIGQTLNRNTVFDRVSGLWRVLSADATGRLLTSQGSALSTILSSATVTVPAGGIQLIAASTNRGGVYLENIGTEAVRLGFVLPITTGIMDFPNDSYINLPSYQGILVANAGVSVSVCQVLVIEYA